MTSRQLIGPVGDLPADFDRHHASPDMMRAAMRALADPDAATGGWPELVDLLLRVGRTDVPTARLVEAHVDALRIHAQAGAEPVPGALYAVWASRSQATGIRATRDAGGWVLDGTLRFASGAGVVDRALVPVWTGPETHVLLDFDVSAWTFDPNRWRTRAMAPARSHETRLRTLRTEAPAIGAENFYLDRPGFFPGGVGVAAAWLGGAQRVADLLEESVPATRRTEGQRTRLGRIRTELAAGALLLRQVAVALDDDAGQRADPRWLPTVARAAVATGVRRVLAEARTVAGPAGLAFAEDLTRAVDDLTLFVAQQNEDADALWLGESS